MWARALYCVLLAAVASEPVALAEGRADFDQRMGELNQRVMLGQSSAERLEEDYLALLGGTDSPEQRGIVFSKLAWMYAMVRNEGYSAVTVMYCDEALSYPVAAEVRGELHTERVGALWAIVRQWSGGRFEAARRQVLRCALDGLAGVLDAGAPKQRVPPPTVSAYTTAGVIPELEKKHAAEVGALEKARLLNRLADAREGLVRWCVSIYRRPPANAEELRCLASEALPKYPEVVHEMMDRLQSGK